MAYLPQDGMGITLPRPSAFGRTPLTVISASGVNLTAVDAEQISPVVVNPKLALPPPSPQVVAVAQPMVISPKPPAPISDPLPVAAPVAVTTTAFTTPVVTGITLPSEMKKYLMYAGYGLGALIVLKMVFGRSN